MQQFVVRCLTILAFAFVALALTGCGSDGPTVITDLECTDEEECSEDQICSEGYCVECDGSGEHCAAGESCVEGSCELAPNYCEEDDECTRSSQKCVDNVCKFVTRQCLSVGQECDPDEPTTQDFSCEDLGRGYQCYKKCKTPRICTSSGAGTDFKCNRHEGCILDPDIVDTPVCQPSECDDFFDTEQGCAELEASDTKELDDGVNCVAISRDALICEPAGASAEGEHCSDTRDCSEGLTCVNRMAQRGSRPDTEEGPFVIEDGPFVGSLGDDSFCARACDSGDMCDAGESCIGAEGGATAERIGICGQGCDAFDHDDEDQCDEDTACVPITSNDGMCFRETTRERDYYESCDTTEQCPDNSHCTGLPLVGIDRRCMPLCDLSLATQAERDASCPTGTDGGLGGNCVDLHDRPQLTGEGRRPPQIGSGVCLQGCTESDDWGRGGCFEEGDGCSRFGGNDRRPDDDLVEPDFGWCTEAGLAELGESCERVDDCADGLHCDKTGDGTGQCRSMCQPGEQTNDNIGCTDDEICIGLIGKDNIGECRIPCEPGDDGTDPNCPANQHNCFDTDDGAYCAASGDISVGDECGDPVIQNCAPGLVCVADQGISPGPVGFLEDPFLSTGAEGICRETCDAFSGPFEDSGCPDGTACSPSTPDGPNPVTGHCFPETDLLISGLESCPVSEIGKMCGDNAYCINTRSNICAPTTSMCYEMCNYLTGGGCSGDSSCEDVFSGGPLLGFMGLCI